ncbi:HipA family kinase [Natronosporangium hydrolyticum]|uniref:HipA family kinase n=1 Tax=Natronosporangium hydrolyticum TaxID=2811111 RepID=UPI001EFA1E6E|nr:HipA family kinase [Natronosporangium hydrolyticum]
MLRTTTAARYVTPFREGGSLPGLMEAVDLGSYVVKFHGAGQGRKTLVAEVISGCLAQLLGLPVPDLVAVEVDPILARGEPDPEVQDLLRASGGLNLGCDYLPGALDFDPAAFPMDPSLAGQVLWFDALVGNVDRTWRNPNMLYWHGQVYLIDHGATLTFHHHWPGAPAAAARAYDARDHVLIEFDPRVEAADADLAPQVTRELLQEAVAHVPDVWLADEPGFADPDQVRRAYVDQLAGRLEQRAAWLPGLVAAAAATGADRDRTTRPAQNRPSWLTGKVDW